MVIQGRILHLPLLLQQQSRHRPSDKSSSDSSSTYESSTQRSSSCVGFYQPEPTIPYNLIKGGSYLSGEHSPSGSLILMTHPRWGVQRRSKRRQPKTQPPKNQAPQNQTNQTYTRKPRNGRNGPVDGTKLEHAGRGGNCGLQDASRTRNTKRNHNRCHNGYG